MPVLSAPKLWRFVTMDLNDPYLILLRRELTQAQARLRRAERERDQAHALLEKLRLRTAKKTTDLRKPSNPPPK
jgi:hypothetical protein